MLRLSGGQWPAIVVIDICFAIKLEYKTEAMRLVRNGQSIAAVARILGIADQTLHNWLKADDRGNLAGATSKPVSADQSC
jgi:transposase-like protein